MVNRYSKERIHKRLLIWCLNILIIMVVLVQVDEGGSQVAPIYGDPDISVAFNGHYFQTSFQNSMNIANISGSVDCLISANTPDGTKVRVDLQLKDEFQFSNWETLVFDKGGETNKDFHFKYFIEGEHLEGEDIVITLSAHWEYMGPEEGSGDISPIMKSVEIGPYGKLDLLRVRPEGSLTLEKNRWKTIELMIQNHGNTEERVMIGVLENPSGLELDLKRGWVMVGPFGEFPFTFTIRCSDNRDIDSYLTMKIDTVVDGIAVEASHRIEIGMEKKEEGIDLNSTALLMIIPSFLILFFGVMFVFWIKLVSIRKKKGNHTGPDHSLEEEVQ